MPRKILKGKVVSTKMNKTAVVEVMVNKQHKVYKKNISVSKRYNARNDINAVEGDMVTIAESKPYSKTVKWVLVESSNKEE